MELLAITHGSRSTSDHHSRDPMGDDLGHGESQVDGLCRERP
jgi:hypothetical protein